MGTWFPAKKEGCCSRCGEDIAVGDQMYAASKGVYMCRSCGQKRDTGELEMGRLEASAVESLKKFPPEAMDTVVAQGVLYLARYLDFSDVSPREIPNFTKEIRQSLAHLELMFPPVPENDETSNARERRERRLSGLASDWAEP